MEVQKETVDNQQSWEWLRHANLNSERGTHNCMSRPDSILRAKILKFDKDPQCRRNLVVAGCPILAKKA